MNDKNDLPEVRGPWLCRSREAVYSNDWLSVSHEQVTTPAGTEGIYGVIHFKHTAVGVVALDTQQNITLVHQFRYVLNQGSWEIPEGGCHSSEASLDCAKRELQEEAGLCAEQWQKLLDIHTSNSVTDETAVIYLATELSNTTQSLEASESDLQVTTVPFETALKMVDDGDITDALSITAIYKVARLLNV